jgi:thymidylate synthase
MEPGMVNIVFGDYHIYAEHIDMVKIQIEREPYNLCKLKMKEFKNLKEVENSSYEDYMLVDYIAHPAIKAHMIA